MLPGTLLTSLVNLVIPPESELLCVTTQDSAGWLTSRHQSYTPTLLHVLPLFSYSAFSSWTTSPFHGYQSHVGPVDKHSLFGPELWTHSAIRCDQLLEKASSWYIQIHLLELSTHWDTISPFGCRLS